MKRAVGTIFGAAILAGLLAGKPASAGTIAGGVLSAGIDVSSDYRFRGISQDDRKPIPQGTLNWSGPKGFYVGTWESGVDWGGNTPSYEADWYVGKHTDIRGTDLNIEAYYYSYPGYEARGSAKASFYEGIAQLSHTFGPLTLTVTGAGTPQWLLESGTGWYAEGTGTYAVNDWISVSGNVGHQWVQSAPSGYTHWDIGATLTWRNISLDGRYVGNDIASAACSGFWMAAPSACRGGFVATVTYNVANLLR